MPGQLDLHATAMAEFDRRMHLIGGADWHRPTPCEEWDVRALVAHLVSEQLWVPHLLDGGTIAEAQGRFDGDVLGSDPVAAWEEASRAARTAWLEPGALERTVHLSFGDAPGSLYLWQMTFDLAVHAWDLAQGIGADATLDPGLVRDLIDSERFEEEIGAVQDGGGAGIFAPEKSVPNDAGPQQILLARTGRTP
ncbi:TIGR03086 family metal-binding protein [Nocardiopsis potens]|uniref:TIGR03086 family metal-binding protein n=1 Tax=Nocardiopsis potens TaxID=1246458 RepID=UPI00034C9F50|nr:TIGR03086 family metal-binding protein [Nocardiopsis potens]